MEGYWNELGFEDYTNIGLAIFQIVLIPLTFELVKTVHGDRSSKEIYKRNKALLAKR